MTGPCTWSSCLQPGALYPDGHRCQAHTPAALSGRMVPVSATPYRPQANPNLVGVLPWHVVIARFEAQQRRQSLQQDALDARQQAERKLAHIRIAEQGMAYEARDLLRPIVDLALPEVPS